MAFAVIYDDDDDELNGCFNASIEATLFDFGRFHGLQFGWLWRVLWSLGWFWPLGRDWLELLLWLLYTLRF